MHIVIVGCGRVGSSLAEQLTTSGHSVVIIDRRREAFDRLSKHFSGERIAGVGFDRDVLLRAGIERADAVAAVTSGDNSNILVARVAKETFGISRVVARIYDPRRAEIYQRLGIATVATVSWTTEQVMRRIVPDIQTVEWVDPTARVSLVEQIVDDALAGREYSEIEQSMGTRLVAVTRLGVTSLPKAGLIAQSGDVTYVAVPAAAPAVKASS